MGRRKKFVPYPHQRLRNEFSGFLRGRRRSIVVMLLRAFAIGAVVTTVLIVAEPHGPILWYVVGAVDGSFATFALAVVAFGFFVFTPAAMRYARGALGEDNTKDVLHGLRRHVIWGYVPGIATSGGDIDHLVVTRRGGVLAIDSKWRNEVTAEDIDGMASSAVRAARRAASILRSKQVGVLERERQADHRMDQSSLTVRPVVVVWGTATRGMPQFVERGEVAFVAGPHLKSWLSALVDETVDEAVGRELLARLQTFRDRPSTAKARRRR